MTRITIAEFRRMATKRKPVTKAPAKPKKARAPKPPVQIHWRVATSPGRVVVTIDGLKLVSDLNQREHHMAKYRRKCRERDIVHAALLGVNLWHWVARPLRVTITRVGPKRMDPTDNLPSACKATIDCLAEILGVDDGSSVVDWRVEQKPVGERRYAVEIVIESREKHA